MGVTGVEATSSVGEVEITQSPIVLISGVGATSLVGSITLDDMQVGLTGLGTTSSTGALNPADVMGLTGVQATSSVNATGIAFPGTYERLTPKTSTGYTNRAPKTSTGYTRRTPV
jgi:hypothetical protein